MMQSTQSNSDIKIFAKVKRADGTIVNLGCVNGRFPWRAWVYRAKMNIRKFFKGDK